MENQVEYPDKRFCSVSKIDDDCFSVNLVLTEKELKSLQRALADHEDDENLETLGYLTLAIERDLNLG
jgi:hypothetical protein